MRRPTRRNDHQLPRRRPVRSGGSRTARRQALRGGLQLHLRLMLVFKALGVEGEVILPSFTFFATAHSALWSRLRPVFADCDPETWTISPEDAERKITSRTAAILGVHLYGNPCEIATLSGWLPGTGLSSCSMPRTRSGASTRDGR